ncbi:hypothetical protein RHGRI_025774 [Rhododendron griersonianum]|uniref:Solute carrier family 35 member F1 n=1 Tax=Rhododendron griersonianum TaxID=479676 RepID=A0AAV6IUW8_9ERIC|nr:hypothetical protein RHGRI_025774 [Rhododendron griersonianum]
MNNMVALKKLWMKKTIVGLVLGQLLSLLITSTGFSSSELTRRGINAPTSQSFLNYVLLALFYGCTFIHRKKALKAKWYYYVLLGLVDVEANFLVSLNWKGVSFDYGFLTVTDSKEMDLDIEILVVKAYQYTSITSIMLLDCWSIPSVIFLTWFFLKTKYRLRKAIGVAICVVGLVVVVFSDVHAKDRSGGSNPLKGDLLVIAGSTLYAISNVSEEFFVKSADRVELMAMLGYFGAIISACQINPYRSILERNELKSIHWSAGAVFPFIGFAVAMFLFYSGVPILLKVVMETFGSLKEEIQHRELVIWRLQGFVLLVRMFHHSNEWVHNAKPLFVDLRHVDCFDSHLCIPSEGLYLQSCCIPPQVDWMYFLAFATVAVGLVIYSGFLQHIYPEFGYLMLVIRGDKEEEQKSADVGDEEVERSKHFDEEAGSVGRRSKTGESSSSSKIDLASTGTAERADNSRVLEKDNTREAI